MKVCCGAALLYLIVVSLSGFLVRITRFLGMATHEHRVQTYPPILSGLRLTIDEFKPLLLSGFSSRLQSPFSHEFFWKHRAIIFQVCIDEAAFATDVIMLPILLRSGRLILCGDHCQLPPVHLSGLVLLFLPSCFWLISSPHHCHLTDHAITRE